MHYIILLVVFFLISCNGNSSKSQGKVSSGSISSKQVASEFSRTVGAGLPPSLQLDTDELSELQSEGLITNEEAQLIKENL